jgi:hypothetical protein
MEKLDLRKKENEYVIRVGNMKYPVFFMHLRDWDYAIIEREGQEPRAVKELNPCGGITVAYVRFIDEIDCKKPILEDLNSRDMTYGGLFFDNRLNIIGAYGVTCCHTEEQYNKSEGRKYSLQRLKQVLSIRKIVF